MVVVFLRSVVFVFALGGVALSATNGFAQSAPISLPVADETAKGEGGERPLPDIPALMHAVEVNQRASEAIE